MVRAETSDRIAAAVSPARDFPRSQGPRLTYLLCAVPRCGSTVVAGMLADTGMAGDPREYLHPRYRTAFCRQRGLGEIGWAEYLERVRACRTSPNGVFGMSVHFHQVLALQEDAEGKELLRALLGGADRIIHLRRADRIGQAISLSRAKRSDVWSLDVDSVSVGDEEVFSATDITWHLHSILAQDEGWEHFFAGTGRDRLRVTYEQIDREPEAVMRAIFRSIGIDVATVPPPRYRRQADATTRLWRERYLEILGIRGGDA